MEKGLSSYNQPLNGTLALIYDLPFGKGRRLAIQSKALEMAFGGWQLNVINTATSGLPLNISYSATSQAQVSTLVTERPDLTGQPIYLNSSNRLNHLNAAACNAPSYTQPFGNGARNVAKMPAFYETNLGPHKNFGGFGVFSSTRQRCKCSWR